MHRRLSRTLTQPLALTAAALAVFLAAPTPALAGGAAVVNAAQAEDSDNAALGYLRAASILTHITDDLQWKPGEPLSDTLRADCAKASEDPTLGIPTVLRASLKPDCDFGIEYSQGPGCLLPHVAQMRRLALVLLADATRLAEADDDVAAAERIAAVFRMGRHLDDDHVALSSLVAAAMAQLACDTIASVGDLDPGASASIVASIDAYDAKDPFGLRAAILNEGKFMGQWAASAGDGPAVADLLAAAYAGESTDLAAIRRLDAAGVKREAVKFRRFTEDAAKAMDAKDPAAALDEIERQAKEGKQYGLLSPTLASAVSNMRQSEGRVREALRTTRAALTK